MRYPDEKMLPGNSYPTLQFGELVITEYQDRSNITVKFKNTGFILKNVSAGNIRKGRVKDWCAPSVGGKGFVGSGKFHPKIHSRAYGLWSDILRRVFNPSKERIKRNYFDCTVHENWLNFQNFAEWYYHQPYHDVDGYEIDKDLKLSKNRVYGPDTCLIIPKELNLYIVECKSFNRIKHGVRKLPYGNKYFSEIVCRGKLKKLGIFNSVDETYQAYQKAKLESIVWLANELFREGKLTEEILLIVKDRYS